MNPTPRPPFSLHNFGTIHRATRHRPPTSISMNSPTGLLQACAAASSLSVGDAGVAANSMRALLPCRNSVTAQQGGPLSPSATITPSLTSFFQTVMLPWGRHNANLGLAGMRVYIGGKMSPANAPLRGFAEKNRWKTPELCTKMIHTYIKLLIDASGC